MKFYSKPCAYLNYQSKSIPRVQADQHIITFFWMKLAFLQMIYRSLCTLYLMFAPICYVHLAAAQVAQFMKFENISETSSSQGGNNASSIPQLPKFHTKVWNSMFFVSDNEIMIQTCSCTIKPIVLVVNFVDPCRIPCSQSNL
ncbi:hypothetical protein MtrunA17_Chr5g0448711 [Medicago truncatula]|uniref:Transmembrane protein, putative n=1 Tax=Medicago truncatula TaxID=3880 RepID=G7KFG6_MEDTR|nr:transmembrane protein, putative [Medicago truncatula]RHN58215.1 hypothetical protein MtrunA17_Chr5g0448711 [Medicago truncatula]